MDMTVRAPIVGGQDLIRADWRGPILHPDDQLIEKPAHLNPERLPERGVHAKGLGTHGTLTIAQDISRCGHGAMFSAICWERIGLSMTPPRRRRRNSGAQRVASCLVEVLALLAATLFLWDASR